MKVKVSGMFNFTDRLQMESLNKRAVRNDVLSANIANAETPGFRALGYDFEEQLQDLAGDARPLPLKTTNDRHKSHSFTQADGSVLPDVYVRPTETVGNDGNTVDVDHEMVSLAQNQILYRSTVETINRKIGILKYAIQGGR